MADVPVVVVGGGLGGLLMAVELRRRGTEVVVLEAADRPGGIVQTIEEDGYLLEPAAGAFALPHPHLSPLLAEAGVEVVAAEAVVRRRWLLQEGRLHELPSTPQGALTSRVLSWRGKARALREAFVPPLSNGEDESLSDFLARRFGSEAGGLAATLMAAGVYAADPHRLSTRSAFPMLTDLEAGHGSVLRGALRRMRSRSGGAGRVVLHVPPRGMAALALRLSECLGGGWRPGRGVGVIEGERGAWHLDGSEALEADHVVVAVRPEEAATIVPRDVAAALQGSRAAGVAIVGLGGRAADLPLPPGFGFLVAPGEPERIGGALFESEYAPGRAPEGCRLAKVIVGGATDEGLVDRSDAELVSLAVEDVGRALGRPVEPSWTKVVRHRPGVPQYEVGHSKWLAGLDEALSQHSGLHLAGWGYRAIGVSGLASEASRLADRILG